jgi:hypothetical protein
MPDKFGGCNTAPNKESATMLRLVIDNTNNPVRTKSTKKQWNIRRSAKGATTTYRVCRGTKVYAEFEYYRDAANFELDMRELTRELERPRLAYSRPLEYWEVLQARLQGKAQRHTKERLAKAQKIANQVREYDYE